MWVYEAEALGGRQRRGTMAEAMQDRPHRHAVQVVSGGVGGFAAKNGRHGDRIVHGQLAACSSHALAYFFNATSLLFSAIYCGHTYCA